MNLISHPTPTGAGTSAGISVDAAPNAPPGTPSAPALVSASAVTAAPSFPAAAGHARSDTRDGAQGGTRDAALDAAPGDSLLAALDTALHELESVEHAQRALEARRLHALTNALAAARALPNGNSQLAFRSLRAEIAAILHLSEYRVEIDLAHAYALTATFHHTRAALTTGAISLGHTKVLTQAAIPLGIDPSPEADLRRERFEHEVLELARTHTPQQLRPLARRIASRLLIEQPLDSDVVDELAVEEQHRSVSLVQYDNGMCDVTAYVPLIVGRAVMDRVRRLGKAAVAQDTHHTTQRNTAGKSGVNGLGDGTLVRSMKQASADVFIDLLLGGHPTQLLAGSPEEAVRASVQLVVTAPDHDTTGGVFGVSELVGSDIISPHTARAYAAHQPVWEKVTVSRAGDVLTVDRYRPSAEIRRRLGARDVHCRFPGCRVPVDRCDLDHTVAASDGGATATDNLAYLCRGHHTVKHHTGWRMTQHPGGVVRWVSPTGRELVTEPPGRVRFMASDTTPQASGASETARASEAPRASQASGARPAHRRKRVVEAVVLGEPGRQTEPAPASVAPAIVPEMVPRAVVTEDP
ncbi:TPA: DUF222 domain-containing protein, partial [Streptococcus pneumoniae]